MSWMLALLLVAQAKNVEKELQPLRGDVQALRFSPDSKWLAAAEKKVVLIDTQTWQARDLGKHDQLVGDLAFAPDGKSLASGGWDRVIKIWDVESAKETGSLSGHPDGLSALAYSPNGEWLASADWSGFVKVWDVKAKQELGSVKGHDRGVGSIVWSKDGRSFWAASWDGKVRTYQVSKSLRAGHEVKLPIPGCHIIVISPDGKKVVTGAGEGEMYALKSFDASTGNELAKFKPHEFSLRRAAFSSDGLVLASASGDDTTLKLWNVESGASIKEFSAGLKHGRMHSLAFSPNGARLAVGSEKGTIYVFAR
jgi:WD40 repeat protein